MSRGFVTRAGRSYAVGPRLFELAGRAGAGYPDQLFRMLMPYLVELYERTNGAVSIAVLGQAFVMYSGSVHNHRNACVARRAGECTPAQAAGRLLLAYEPGACCLDWKRARWSERWPEMWSRRRSSTNCCCPASPDRLPCARTGPGGSRSPHRCSGWTPGRSPGSPSAGGRTGSTLPWPRPRCAGLPVRRRSTCAPACRTGPVAAGADGGYAVPRRSAAEVG